MPSMRFELDNEGLRKAALTGPDVRAAIRQVAESTAARAESYDEAAGVESPKSEIRVATGGIRRARAYVQANGAAAAAREAKYRILGRALGGGR